ncbi:hypothetical protein A5797_002160, partial [Enterococcus faecalis]
INWLNKCLHFAIHVKQKVNVMW